MADPHNDYLTYAATAGIPSAVAYAGMIFSGIILSYKRLRQNKFAILLLAILSGYAVQSLLTPTVVSYSFILWILLGAVAALDQTNGTRSITTGGVLE